MTTVALHTAAPIFSDATTLAKMSLTTRQHIDADADARSVSPKSALPYRKLRVMIVDDNRINLSVLGTLLKRRFGDLLQGPPLAVDSALKAIQLLRTQVFDLILMDIQMPFLSGLDATRRIRDGEDGVLQANRGVRIVAVTTAIGDEPELAYRRADMDGMIGKPVRFQDIAGYLCPLSHEAYNAATPVDAVMIDDERVMPPLPPPATPSNGAERFFYLPTDGSMRAPPPDICHGANFEQMLRAQTRASLRNGGAMAVARAGTWHASTAPSRRGDGGDDSTRASARAPQETDERISEEEMTDRCSSASESRSNSSEALVPATWHQKEKPQSPKAEAQRRSPQHRHVRTPSSSYSKRTLSLQIAREMERMAESSDLSDAGSATRKSTSYSSQVRRPPAIYRISSPPCLFTTPAQDPQSMTFVTSPTAVTQLRGVPFSAQRDDGSTPPDSELSSEADDANVLSPTTSTGPSHSWDFDRRDSQTSNGSITSDASTEASTPASEHLYNDAIERLRPVGGRPLHYFSRNRPSARGVVEPWLDAGQTTGKATDASLRPEIRSRYTQTRASCYVSQLTESLQKLDTAD